MQAVTPGAAGAYPRPFPPAAAPRQPALRLTVTAGPEAGRVFPVVRFPAVIGRGPEAAVRLDGDPRVSRAHAEILLRDGRPVLCDLSSRHGTFLNHQPIQRMAAPAPGDVIQVGASQIHWEEMSA